MSKLDKLREKHLRRQAAADSGLEALLLGGGSAAGPSPPAAADGPPAAAAIAAVVPPAAGAAPAAANGSHDDEAGAEALASGEVVGGGGSPFDVRHAAAPAGGSGGQTPKKRTAAAAALPAPEPNGGAAAVPPAFTARGPCPASPRELRLCALHFMCSSPAFGPLPVSGVGLNAALRREYMKAGHERAALGVFRAADTVASLRAIHQDLQAKQCSGALVLDDTADGDDLLIVSVDTQRLVTELLTSELASGEWRSNGPWGKRMRRPGLNGGGEGLLALPMEASMAAGAAARERAAALYRRGIGSLGPGGPDSVEDLLKAPTSRQRQLIDAGDELRKLLAEPTARQSLTAQRFMNKSQNMAQFCPHGSRADCRKAIDSAAACAKIHFKKIIKPWTDESLGDCSYLDTCRHIDKCKYVHYALDLTVEQAKYLNECGVHNRGTDTKRINELAMKGMELPAQWIQCDLRVFPLSIFNGLISVVMADPPWDIHMELPYGTLTDDEVRNLKIGEIHEDGMIFLWVTGRAMELARDCFRIWGYKRIEDLTSTPYGP